MSALNSPGRPGQSLWPCRYPHRQFHAASSAQRAELRQPPDVRPRASADRCSPPSAITRRRIWSIVSPGRSAQSRPQRPNGTSSPTSLSGAPEKGPGPQDRSTAHPPMGGAQDHPLLHTFARFCQRARRAIVIPVRRKTIGTADKQHRAPSAETARNTVRPDNRPQPTQKGSAIMKQIIAVVENTTLDEIQAALPDMPVWSTTVSTVHQYEGRDVATRVYRGVRYTTRFTDRVRLDI